MPIATIRQAALLAVISCAAAGIVWSCLPVSEDPAGAGTGGGTDTVDLCADVECSEAALGVCQETWCDAATGDCVVADLADGSYCSTGDVCVIAQFCEAGVCNEGEAPLPDCAGLECGPDDCGLDCGSCAAGLECSDGLCLPPCTPNCEGFQCGDDGCEGSCGTCADDEFCTLDQQCEIACEPDCGDAVCGDDGCGGSCGSCADGFFCNGGTCGEDCVPQCDGKACGDDGCGGTCGDCDEPFDCSEEGQCVDPLPPCGNIPAVGCCEGLLLKFCQDAVLETVPCEATCGWLADPGYYDCDGNATGADPSGSNPQACPGG